MFTGLLAFIGGLLSDIVYTVEENANLRPKMHRIDSHEQNKQFKKGH